MQRSSCASSPLRTVVMRDSDASWVGATLSESMLKPRPENMPETRARTPNLFSTRTEIVCRMEKEKEEKASDSRSIKPGEDTRLHSRCGGSEGWWTLRDSNPRHP